MRIYFFVFFILISSPFKSISQETPEFIPGEIILQFNSDENFNKFLTTYNASSNFKIKYVKKLSNYLNLHFFTYDYRLINGKTLANILQQNKFVKIAGQNFKAEHRATIPSDEFFNDQVYLDLIKAPEAWDIATAAPEEVVIAVVEGGDIDHEDLKDNIWTNNGEIPDDGIDNDNNGYTDDYFGVNVVDSTDTPIADDHATSVAGIIGASGDNSTGVSGILWDVNMMIVSNDLTFIKIVESYEYIYNMRKKYNDTNGTEGAFIIATNSSFGRNNAFPNQLPIYSVWCEAYNMMGSVGILSAASTNNSKINIELEGDMPCMCSSDYLITVTNTNLDDELVSGFGWNAIDIAAPGNVFTTKSGSEYGSFGGTSAAAPVITGAIGMMYSYPCENFLVQARIQPEATAMQIKNTLLSSVDPVEELFDKTVSGGRVNLFKAMQGMENNYGSAKGDLGFIKVFPVPARENLFVEYQTSENTEYKIRIYDSVGRLVYEYQIPKICGPKQITVPLQNFAQGVYFMSIENDNNIESTSFEVY